MAVPKKRLTNTRSGNRRSHKFLTKLNLTPCRKCGEMIVPHHVCLNCGTYKNDQVIDFSKREKKKNN